MATDNDDTIPVNPNTAETNPHQEVGGAADAEAPDRRKAKGGITTTKTLVPQTEHQLQPGEKPTK